MKFNLGKYNVGETRKSSITANSDFYFDSNLSGYILERYQEKVNIAIEYETEIKGVVEIPTIPFSIEINYDTKAMASNFVYSEKCESSMDYDAYAIGAMIGEEYLEIKGIELEPGAEVEIDMCDLTVTVNGENAIHLLATDCDFFDFLPGVNEVNIVARGSDSMEIRIYWKDRWL